MRPDSPLQFESTLADVVQEIAPALLRDLQGWKFCRGCGGMCMWGTAKYDATDDNLICPHCGLGVLEYPPGVPLSCKCGLSDPELFYTFHGDAVCLQCGVIQSPPDEYFPDTSGDLVPVPSPQQALRIASGGPGVEGAEPLLHREVPVDPLSN